MKKFIFLVLVIALLAAAHFTRPIGAKGLTHLMVAQLPQADQTIVQTVGGEDIISKNVEKHVTLVDKFLWVDAQADGKTIFIGAFGHWFPRADIAYRALMDLDNFKDKAINAVEQHIPAGVPGGDKVKDGLNDLTNKVKLPGQ